MPSRVRWEDRRRFRWISGLVRDDLVLDARLGQATAESGLPAHILAMQVVTLVCLRWEAPIRVNAAQDLNLVPFALLGAIGGSRGVSADDQPAVPGRGEPVAGHLESGCSRGCSETSSRRSRHASRSPTPPPPTAQPHRRRQSAPAPGNAPHTGDIRPRSETIRKAPRRCDAPCSSTP